jgi:two-component system, sensor histidine kinase RpfC
MIGKIKSLLATRTPEQEILFNRLVIGAAAAVGCYIADLNAGVTTAFIVYLLANAALFIMQRAHIFQPQSRWYIAIILDVWMAVTAMAADPELMSWAYPMILWMILGNGFRFGLRFLAFASVLSAIGFGWGVVSSTDYWANNKIVGYGLTVGLIIIPAYCSTLIHKLSKAKEQAEIASKAKSYFLASVSHELRTPLNAILGYGNHLKQMDLPKKQHDMVEATVLAGDHLLNLIEQLIQVAKTESGTAVIKNNIFRPTDIMTEIRDIMAIRAEQKGLTLKLHAAALSDELLDGPEETIRNILINLMGNAIKFTDSGTVSISSAIRKEQDRVALCLTVSDTGIGIADGAKEKIFKPFQQADDTVMNRFGGTGLGLAICLQLVEQVGGTIIVNSKIGRGSEFEVTIPVTACITETTNEITDTNQDTIHIISFGELRPELLASAQSSGNFVVRHMPCMSIFDLQTAVDSNDLYNYKIALIDSKLAVQIGPEDRIWNQFSAAEVAPVLVAGNEAVDIEDITLRAAFASVIPATPNFQQLRSAVRIGCSFARHADFTDDESEIETRPLTARSVLVADDNRTNCNVLAAILESAGHKVTLVSDGDEALDALEAGGIDILLLDVNMPRLNGIDACAMWRQIEGGRSHLPIIGVTADATVETEARCLAAGMDLRITKPVDAKLLLNSIEQYCGGIGATADAALPQSYADPLGAVVALQRSEAETPSSIDPAQIEYLLSIGNSDFVAEMIDSFRNDIDETMLSIGIAVANADVHQFRFCAHAFKSSANNIGALKLAAMGNKLEKITEGDFRELGAIYLDKIENELLGVQAALDAELSKLAATSQKGPHTAFRAG